MKTLLKSVSLIAVGIVLGVAIERGVISAATAQQREGGGRRGPAPLTMEQLPAEVAQLKALVPSNSHIMMDVQFHWTNLWWAGKKKNWPLAPVLLQRDARPHSVADQEIAVMIVAARQQDVDIEGIFDGIDTSSLAAVKTAIEQKDSAEFAADYKTMLESCYACHKSVGRPYLRPMIPKLQTQAILNMDPYATWPE